MKWRVYYLRQTHNAKTGMSSERGASRVVIADNEDEAMEVVRALRESTMVHCAVDASNDPYKAPKIVMS